tara:strand:+ start:659 stop:1135 length:477 start_codon:yes stop_codon:yes gene_type:complete
MNKKFTHFNQDGEAHMVSIKDKEDTNRVAIASGSITMSVETIKMIKMGSHKKGDVINVARIAAIMAVKNTPSMIPLCHNINITSVDIDFEIQESACEVNCMAKIETFGKTGAEIEAIHGVSIGLITIYDMCKSVDRSMIINKIRLDFKEGGKSGKWER